MHRTIKVGLDFDGVIADSHSLKSVIAKNLYGVEISGPFSRKNVVGTQLTLEQYEETKKALYYGDYEIQPISFAPYYIRIMIEQGYILKVVTSRSGEILAKARNLLGRLGMSDLPIFGVGYGKSKDLFCEGLDVFVEDDVEKLLPLFGKVKHLLLFTQEENKEMVLPDGIVRVNDWYEVYQYIRYEICS